MGLTIIKFIFEQIAKVFQLMANIELWPGMSLLMFYCVLFLIPFVIKIYHVIYDETVNTAESDFKYFRRIGLNERLKFKKSMNNARSGKHAYYQPKHNSEFRK